MANKVAGAAAYKRLQPTKPIEIGNLVEENIRYWKKYDDAEDAAKKARKAKEVELRLKKDKDAWKLLESMTPDQSKGQFNEGMMQSFEYDTPEITDLAKKSNGFGPEAFDAKQKLQKIKNDYLSLSKGNKAFGEKGDELDKTEANYNKWLDKPIKDFRASMSKGLFNIQGRKAFIYSPGDKVVEGIDPSAILSHPYLSSSYSGKPTFDEDGLAMSKQLLDTRDGQEQIDLVETKRDGLKLVNNRFAEDEIQARSWFAKMQQEDPKFAKGKSFYNLTAGERDKVVDNYYTENVQSRILEDTSDTSAKDAIEKQRLANLKQQEKNLKLEAAKKRLAIRKGRKSERESSSKITIAKDETGNVVKRRYMNEQKSLKKSYNQVAIENADTYVIGSNGVTFYPVKGSEKTAVTMTNLLVEKDGTTVGVAKRITKEPVLDQDGVEIPGKFTDKESDVFIRDKTALNNFATLIDKEDGKPHKDLEELTATLKKAKAGVKSTVDPTKQKIEPKSTTQKGNVR